MTPFDFSNLHSVEAEGEWGLPLINDAISISEVLENVDSIQYLHIGEDGGLLFIAEAESDAVVKASDLMSIANNIPTLEINGIFDEVSIPSIHGTYNFPIDEDIVKVQLFTDSFQLKEVDIKSGTIHFDVNLNIMQNYSINLESEQIQTASGEPFHIMLNGQHDEIDLSGCSMMVGEDGYLRFSGETSVQCDENAVDEISYHISVGLQNLVFKRIEAKLISYHSDFDDDVNINFNMPNLEGAITVYNPKLSLFSRNAIHTTAECHFTEASCLMANGSSSPLFETPLNINIPYSPDEYVPCLDNVLQMLHYDTRYIKCRLAGDVVVNPDGMNGDDVILEDDQTIGFRARAEVPLNISIDNCVYKDTFNVSLKDMLNPDNIDFIETLTLRMEFLNGLPFDINVPTICFCNSQTCSEELLMPEDVIIHGGYNDVPAANPPFFIEIPKDKIRDIVDSDHIILKFQINTDGREVKVKTDQFVHVKLGAKVKYSAESFNF